MERAPVTSRLFWCLAAVTVAALAMVLIAEVESDLVLFAALGLMGGSVAVVWRRHVRPPAEGEPNATAVFAVGAVGTLVLINPVTAMLGIGMLGLACLPVAVAVVLAVTFRPVLVRGGW